MRARRRRRQMLHVRLDLRLDDLRGTAVFARRERFLEWLAALPQEERCAARLSPELQNVIVELEVLHHTAYPDRPCPDLRWRLQTWVLVPALARLCADEDPAALARAAEAAFAPVVLEEAGAATRGDSPAAWRRFLERLAMMQMRWFSIARMKTASVSALMLLELEQAGADAAAASAGSWMPGGTQRRSAARARREAAFARLTGLWPRARNRAPINA